MENSNNFINTLFNPSLKSLWWVGWWVITNYHVTSKLSWAVTNGETAHDTVSYLPNDKPANYNLSPRGFYISHIMVQNSYKIIQSPLFWFNVQFWRFESFDPWRRRRRIGLTGISVLRNVCLRFKHQMLFRQISYKNLWPSKYLVKRNKLTFARKHKD